MHRLLRGAALSIHRNAGHVVRKPGAKPTRARDISGLRSNGIHAPEHDTADIASHVYLSTGCLHGHHDYCQAKTGAAGAKTPAKCKFCDARCRCSCHQADQ